MKKVSFTIGQSFYAMHNGEAVKTEILFNEANYEVNEINEIDANKTCLTFVNALFRRFEAKEKGAKIEFRYTEPVNMIVKIDGLTAFNLSSLATSTGTVIKFPAMLARKDQQAARLAVASNFAYAIEASREFTNDAFEAIK